jgi:hypothetical protein
MRTRKIRQLHRLIDRLDRWITDAEPITPATAHVGEANGLLVDAKHCMKQAEFILARHQAFDERRKTGKLPYFSEFLARIK